MLVLERGDGQSIFLKVPGTRGFSIKVTHRKNGRVALALDAPREVKILRAELMERNGSEVEVPDGEEIKTVLRGTIWG